MAPANSSSLKFLTSVPRGLSTPLSKVSVSVALQNQTIRLKPPPSGAHGVIHTAADTSLDLNPDNVVSPMLSAAISIAKAAASTPSCSRLVYTSSSSAVADPAPGIVRELANETYNEETVIAAYSPDLRQDLVGGHTVYAAGKVKTEQALWKWYHSRAPNLIVNTGVNSDHGIGIQSPMLTCFQSSQALATAKFFILKPRALLLQWGC